MLEMAAGMDIEKMKEKMGDLKDIIPDGDLKMNEMMGPLASMLGGGMPDNDAM